MRFLALKRDGYNCRLCGKAGSEPEVDHILPVSRGGANDMDNLQTLCWVCNRGKRGSVEQVWPGNNIQA